MIRKGPHALEATAEQALYIARTSLTQAERFIDAVERTLDLLHEAPEIGRRYESEHPRLSNLQTFRVEGFPNHLLFYTVEQDGIVFVHLLHGARDIPKALHGDLGV